MGGELTVRSNPGFGTEIELTVLPLLSMRPPNGSAFGEEACALRRSHCRHRLTCSGLAPCEVNIQLSSAP